MTSAQLKALAWRELEEGFNQGKIEVLDELYDPNFVDHNPIEGPFSGLEGWKLFLQGVKTAFPDGRFELRVDLAEGDLVARSWRMTGTQTGPFMGMPPTGKEISFTGADILRFKDGRITEIWHVEDTIRLFKQLGLIPPLEGI